MTWALLTTGTASKSKVSMVLRGRQSGFGKMAFDAPPRALGDLMLGKCGKETRRRPSFLVGLGGEVGPYLLDGRQPQLGEEKRDAGGVDGIGRLHAASPGRTVPSSS